MFDPNSKTGIDRFYDSLRGSGVYGRFDEETQPAAANSARWAAVAVTKRLARGFGSVLLHDAVTRFLSFVTAGGDANRDWAPTYLA